MRCFKDTHRVEISACCALTTLVVLNALMACVFLSRLLILLNLHNQDEYKTKFQEENTKFTGSNGSVEINRIHNTIGTTEDTSRINLYIPVVEKIYCMQAFKDKNRFLGVKALKQCEKICDEKEGCQIIMYHASPYLCKVFKHAKAYCSQRERFQYQAGYTFSKEEYYNPRKQYSLVKANSYCMKTGGILNRKSQQQRGLRACMQQCDQTPECRVLVFTLGKLTNCHLRTTPCQKQNMYYRHRSFIMTKLPK